MTSPGNFLITGKAYGAFQAIQLRQANITAARLNIENYVWYALVSLTHFPSRAKASILLESSLSSPSDPGLWMDVSKIKAIGGTNNIMKETYWLHECPNAPRQNGLLAAPENNDVPRSCKQALRGLRMNLFWCWMS